mmetsp:Transcript_67136/g.205581  ORF Transcript_67136/g.205581 Transcript_67136/m.205581 type:complete len:233 (+) Transcript_67136:806-1504(+)
MCPAGRWRRTPLRAARCSFRARSGCRRSRSPGPTPAGRCRPGRHCTCPPSWRQSFRCTCPACIWCSWPASKRPPGRSKSPANTRCKCWAHSRRARGSMCPTNKACRPLRLWRLSPSTTCRAGKLCTREGSPSRPSRPTALRSTPGTTAASASQAASSICPAGTWRTCPLTLPPPRCSTCPGGTACTPTSPRRSTCPPRTSRTSSCWGRSPAPLGSRPPRRPPTTRRPAARTE